MVVRVGGGWSHNVLRHRCGGGNGRMFGGGAQDNGSLPAGVTEKEGDFLRVWAAMARGWCSTRRTKTT